MWLDSERAILEKIGTFQRWASVKYTSRASFSSSRKALGTKRETRLEQHNLQILRSDEGRRGAPPINAAAGRPDLLSVSPRLEPTVESGPAFAKSPPRPLAAKCDIQRMSGQVSAG
jgi:hypothetical protein